MNGRRLLRAIDQLHNLPTLPHVAVRLLQLAADDRSDLKQIVAPIENDQALTAKLLRWVNSAAVGLRQPVSQVSRAVALLGLDAVRQAALSVQFFELLNGKAAASGLPVEQFWRHCLGVAHASAELGAKVDGVDASDAFVAGLLHDLGKLVLASTEPDGYGRALEQVEHGEPILTAEKQCVGLDHTAAGRRLAQRWGLPTGLANAVWLHHQPLGRAPEATAGAAMVQVVWLADALCREMRIGFSGTPASALGATELAPSVGVDAETIAGLRETLPGEVDRRMEILGLGASLSESTQVTVLSRANQQLGETNEALREANGVLRRRAVQWRLLERVHRSAATHDLRAVLAGSAQAWQEGLGAASCLCYALPDEPGCVEGAVWPAQQPDQAHFVLNVADPGDTATGDTDASQGLADSRLLEHLRPRLGAEDFAFLPLRCGSVRVGGLLLGGTVSLCEENADEWGIVAGSTALAIRAALESERRVAHEQALLEMHRALDDAHARLLRSRKLAAVGEMAAGAAHEINNPLAVIYGRAQLLLAREDDPAKRKALAKMADQSQRISEIISELMTFARPPQPTVAPADLNETVGLSLAELASAIQEKRLVVQQSLTSGLPPVEMDGTQIETVLSALLRNATEALADGGTIRVTTRLAGGGRLAEVVVEDNGPGIPPEKLVHVFDPFYSGRDAGRGLGLGLPKSYRIVESHGGDLLVESDPGTRTAFTVRLPLTHASPTEGETPAG